jgi:hypothetical protein
MTNVMPICGSADRFGFVPGLLWWLGLRVSGVLRPITANEP